MKRVLHISKYYAPFNGGTEVVARNCVKALDGEYEQKIICFNHGKGTCTDRVDGVEVLRVGCFAKVASQSLSMSYGRRLSALMQDFGPDAVVFHYPNPFVAAFLLRCIPRGAKLIVYWHLDIVRQKLLGKLFEGQNRRLLERADCLIATSAAYARGSRWLRLGEGKCRIIPNCIDPGRLEATDASREIAARIRAENPGKTLCFAVGRHTRYKGYDHLIRASAHLDDSFLILIGGEGEDTPALKRMAEGNGRVRFLGRIGDDELKGCMQSCDIFCFPSITRNEAFGLALAEAMCCGKPAVTFTIPGSGVNEVCLNGEDGVEVPNGDDEAYARAMVQLAGDPELRRRMGANGRRRVEQNYLYEQFSARVRAMMKDTVNGTHTPGNR